MNNHLVSEIQVSYSHNEADKMNITNSNESFKVILAHWNRNIIEMQEEVKILLLNKSNQVLGIYDLSKGGTSSSFIDVKIVLSIALKALASGIIIAHNHPSGNLNPSKSDINITEKLKSACKIMDIMLLDHLIINNAFYYSFADEGLL